MGKIIHKLAPNVHKKCFRIYSTVNFCLFKFLAKKQKFYIFSGMSIKKKHCKVYNVSNFIVNVFYSPLSF